MEAERARVFFEPERSEVPGSFSMVEIQTGGDELLKRLRELCLQLARGERVLCDLLRELPGSQENGVREFRAHLGRDETQKVLTIELTQPGTARIDWRNTADGWERVCRRIDNLLGRPGQGIGVPLCEDYETKTDGFLSVER